MSSIIRGGATGGPGDGRPLSFTKNEKKKRKKKKKEEGEEEKEEEKEGEEEKGRRRRRVLQHLPTIFKF